MELKSLRLSFLLAFVMACTFSSDLWAQSLAETGAPATVQQRFSPKEERVYFHLGGTWLLRDDFYHTLGYGLDLGYHLRENFALELRAFKLHSWLGGAAKELREQQNLLPDLRQPDALFGLGLRLYGGYGKVLTFNRFVTHFDPHLSLHGGITLAEERIVPTAILGAGILTHYRRGVQVKLDLQMLLHLENRLRGWTPALGFLPVLSIGWSPRTPLLQ